MSAPVYVVLLHYPVTNRRGEVVTTSVTNMDIHDISRTACTYGAEKFYLVTPIEDQHHLVGRIIDHWRTPVRKQEHPDRVEAVSLAKLVRSFEEVLTDIEATHGIRPEVVLTDARPMPNSIGYGEYSALMKDPKRTQPTVIVLGTGWGVSPEFYSHVDRVLAPIYGPNGPEGYNHLSVRAAAAVIFDRLLGT